MLADPAGSPLDRKMTLTQLQALISGMAWIEELTPTGTNATFSSLGSYTHLRIVYSARGDTAATSALINLTFNADGGANYDAQRSGFTTAGAFTDQVAQTSGIIGVVSAASAPASYPSSGEIVIPDYRGTTFFKTATSQVAGPLVAASTTNIFTRLHSVWWRNTVAITSIALTLNAGNFVAGSKFTLYGLK